MSPSTVKVNIFTAVLVAGLLTLLAFRLVAYKGQGTRVVELDNQVPSSPPLVLRYLGTDAARHIFTSKSESFSIPGSVEWVELCKPIDGIPHSVLFLASGDRMTVTMPVSLSKGQPVYVETYGEFSGLAFPRRRDVYMFTPKVPPVTISK